MGCGAPPSAAPCRPVTSPLGSLRNPEDSALSEQAPSCLPRKVTFCKLQYLSAAAATSQVGGFRATGLNEDLQDLHFPRALGGGGVSTTRPGRQRRPTGGPRLSGACHSHWVRQVPEKAEDPESAAAREVTGNAQGWGPEEEGAQPSQMGPAPDPPFRSCGRTPEPSTAQRVPRPVRGLGSSVFLPLLEVQPHHQIPLERQLTSRSSHPPTSGVCRGNRTSLALLGECK